MAAAVSTDERLAAAAALDAAEEQLQSLTASHAGTFVSVERRSAQFQGHLQQLLVEIEAVSQHTVHVSQHVLTAEQCSSSSNSSDTGGHTTTADATLAVLAERHRVRRRTLLQHSSLLELLELPNIMDACVRSNLYEEALQIAAFANTLARRHGTDTKETTTTTPDTTGETTTKSANTVVQQVIAQIRSRQADLRRHLLGRLRVTVTMPECLEVVTAVRRLNAIDLETQSSNTTTASNLEATHAAMEYQLQIAFLEARDVWLDSKTAAAASAHTTYSSRRSLLQQEEPLLDAIERYRTRMFEVATQFNAIFRAQQQAGAASTQLLALWTVRRVQSFLRLLRTELLSASSTQQQHDAAAIRDAVEAAVFFSTSMGRLGADFTCQLPCIFEPILLQMVTHYWKEGVTQLRETLSICREAGVAGPLATEVGTTSATDNEPIPVSLEGPQPAPKKLLSLPPLARLVNAVLNGLNELRRCLLPGIFPALRRCLEEQLQAVSAELLANERIVLTPGLRGEAAALRAIAASLQVVFRDLVEPYLRGSLEAAIGNTAAAIQQHQILRDNLMKAQPQNNANNEEVAAESATSDADGEGQAKGGENVGVKEGNDGSDSAGHQHNDNVNATDEGNDVPVVEVDAATVEPENRS